jgi:UDP-N-acetylmuramoylalanine--D-glutamate ligase
VIDIRSRRNQHLAVFGLGTSGIAAARALAASGATVAAWDDSDGSRRAAADRGVALADLYAADFAALDALVLAPGIRLTHRPHPIVERATAAGRPVIGDIELLVEACPRARFIGITGTNGKSTTTALVGHILREAGLHAQVGGNLGPPALAFDPPAPDEIFVLELSSYQLDLTRNATFDIAVWLNLTPDHLDRHGGMEGYIAAKRRIFRERSDNGSTQVAVIGVDDAPSRRVRDDIAGGGRWTVVPISATRQLEGGVFAADGILHDAIESAAKQVCDLNAITTLPGIHNWQNAAAAYAVARTVGIAPNVIAGALASYPGLPHRMEQVAVIGRVRYVNDSKATNVEAAARALACYDAIYWIAGGQAKGEGLDDILPWASRVRHAFLIGEAEDVFAAALDGVFPVTRCGDLATALRAAHALAQKDGPDGAVVLLSPACASFDQWKNFEERGDRFRTLVRDIAAEAAS